MDKVAYTTVRQAKGWVLTYRKTGCTRRFTSLSAARYGTRWWSLY